MGAVRGLAGTLNGFHRESFSAGTVKTSSLCRRSFHFRPDDSLWVRTFQRFSLPVAQREVFHTGKFQYCCVVLVPRWRKQSLPGSGCSPCSEADTLPPMIAVFLQKQSTHLGVTRCFITQLRSQVAFLGPGRPLFSPILGSKCAIPMSPAPTSPKRLYVLPADREKPCDGRIELSVVVSQFTGNDRPNRWNSAEVKLPGNKCFSGTPDGMARVSSSKPKKS